MKDMELEKIRRAYTRATPNILDSVLSDCKEQKGTDIMTKQTRTWGKTLIAIAAVFALVLTLGGGFGWYHYTNSPTANVSLDVNPSIRLTVNRNEKVLDADALNTDAETVLEDMELEGSHINVAVNAILGAMLRHGYLSVDANTILVSVQAKDAAVGTALEEKLTAQIGQTLSASQFSGAVLSQTMTGEEALEALAQEHHISEGKAQLIRKILAADNHYTFEELAKLSVNELKLLTEKGSMQVQDVTATGHASSSKYIGAEAALEVALAHAGVSADQLTNREIELDWDAGRMLYEVEFDTASREYEYDIDATTGEILKAEKDADHSYDDDRYDDDDDDLPASTTQTYISNEQAKAAAFAQAGISAGEAWDVNCELEEDDGKAYYEVEFETASYEYEYHVDPVTGAATLTDREAQDQDADHSYDDDRYDDDDDDDDDDDLPASTTQTYISNEQAKAAAFAQAGISAGEAWDVNCELEEDDGKAYYEVEFETASYEYEYHVDPVTGAATLTDREAQDQDD